MTLFLILAALNTALLLAAVFLLARLLSVLGEVDRKFTDLLVIVTPVVPMPTDAEGIPIDRERAFVLPSPASIRPAAFYSPPPPPKKVTDDVSARIRAENEDRLKRGMAPLMPGTPENPDPMVEDVPRELHRYE